MRLEYLNIFRKLNCDDLILDKNFSEIITDDSGSVVEVKKMTKNIFNFLIRLFRVRKKLLVKFTMKNNTVTKKTICITPEPTLI